jgi:hypothetical protein
MHHLQAMPKGLGSLSSKLARFRAGRWLWLWLGLGGVCPAQTILIPPMNQTATAGSSVTFNVSVTTPATYIGGFKYKAIYGSSTNVFDTGRTPGTLLVSFTFGPLTDRMTIYYSGSQIHDTGYLGGPDARNFAVSYGPGTNTLVTIIMDEGENQSGSTWEYQLYSQAQINYQWQFNNANILGATNAAYTLDNVTSANAGIYGVVVTDHPGPGTNASATLTVLGPPSITQPPASLAVLPGANTNLSVVATGILPLNYQWRFFGTNLNGATASSYLLSNIQPVNAGNYTVVITNVYGSTTSTVASVKVLVSPTLTNVNGSSTNFGFDFPTVFGSTYVTQYKANWNDTNWTAIATNVGTGNLWSENFPVTSALSNRFYRVFVR